jgi:hypothetical protein
LADRRWQDPLALLLREALRNQTGAAFTAIDAVPITLELAPPALQAAEPYAQGPGQLIGAGACGDSLIEDPMSLPAIVRGRQSSPSSPQKAWIFFAAISRAAASERALSLRRSSCFRRLIDRWSWVRNPVCR